ncbi:enoyl-CoA hydratase/isomerase family protein [Neisseriaceae bacterium TC5R-5]|nr:enoyl-CoA hydratase/isomerase family protein [Neisseriaceae bacterium TC5R-5]
MNIIPSLVNQGRQSTMNYTTLEIEHQPQHSTLWLKRPERHNALNETLIQELSLAFTQLQQATEVRVIVLAGRGSSFCAGGDLDWMRRAANYSEAENLADAQQLANLLKIIYRCPKPVIARIHGAAIGGGTGLAAVCDIAIASTVARFGLSEVRLGLIPATIGPYVADAIGWRQARRYFLSGESISAERAVSLGLVHEVVADDELDSRISSLVAELNKGGPQAMASVKALLARLRQGSPWDDALLEDTAINIARIRIGAEAQEGLAAFFAKRPASWI